MPDDPRPYTDDDADGDDSAQAIAPVDDDRDDDLPDPGDADENTPPEDDD